MSSSTRAAVLRALGQPQQLEEVELRDPAPGEVRVRMLAAGVCGSDVSQAYDGDWTDELPLVLGHEGAAVVEAVHPSVAGFAAGDRVVLNLAPSCHVCRFCSTGRPALCTELSTPAPHPVLKPPSPISAAGEPIGSFEFTGCFAEHAVLSAERLVRLPAGVPPAIGALVGCAVVSGFGAATAAMSIACGSAGAVVGLGGVGASAVMGGRLAGAAEIVAVDPAARRRLAAARIGADRAVSNDEARTLDGQFDWAVAAAGAADAVALAVDLVGSGGTVVVVGAVPPGDHVPIDMRALMRGEKAIRGSIYGSAAPRELMGRIFALYERGRLPLDELISDRFSFEQISEALHAGRSAASMRVVVDF